MLKELNSVAGKLLIIKVKRLKKKVKLSPVTGLGGL
jgi:hypothetical protein